MPRKPSKPRPRKPRPSGAPPLRPGQFASGLPARRPQGAAPARAENSAAAPSRGDRLQKVLAAAGLGSRRECEQLIVEGRVQVDGEVVSELGACVDRQQHEIRVDGEALSNPRLVYYAIHKPTGVVTTTRDPAGRPRVIDLLPPSVGRVFPVGRLDLASEGLILATNDGLLANEITHPRHGVHKTYEVQVAGHPDPDVLAQLRRGVHLSEGFAHAVHVRLKSRLQRSSVLEMVLDEGRNREVRRLLARVGHKVQRLTRVAVGPIRLGDLPRGAYRKLTSEEVTKLKAVAANPGSQRIATGDRAPRPGGRPGGRPPGRAGRPAVAGGKPRRSPGGPAGGPPPRVAKARVAAKPTDGERRSIIGDKPEGPKPAGRKPAGGRKPLGGGKPAGGRKPLGARKPGGGKPGGSRPGGRGGKPAGGRKPEGGRPRPPRSREK